MKERDREREGERESDREKGRTKRDRDRGRDNEKGRHRLRGMRTTNNPRLNLMTATSKPARTTVQSPGVDQVITTDL